MAEECSKTTILKGDGKEGKTTLQDDCDDDLPRLSGNHTKLNDGRQDSHIKDVASTIDSQSAQQSLNEQVISLEHSDTAESVTVSHRERDTEVNAESVEDELKKSTSKNLTEDISENRTESTSKDASEDLTQSASERLVEDASEVLADADDDTSGTLPEKLTKNQLRRIKKHQEWLKTKDQRVQVRREKRKERRHRIQAKEVEVIPRKRKRKMADPDASDVRVVIDCGFDNLMTSTDVTKLSKQIQRSYASNRTSDKPFQFYICNFGSKCKSRFNTALAEHTSWDVHFREQGLNEVFGKDCVVYLTSESPNVLTTLDPGKVYVIGGLVDHNHHKGICYERAVSQGWDHAQLPIKEFMKINTRKVLTVNHVYEILVAYIETDNWKVAFDRVIPQRKFQTMSRKERRRKHHPGKEAAMHAGNSNENSVSSLDAPEPVQHHGSIIQEVVCHDGSTVQEVEEHCGSETMEEIGDIDCDNKESDINQSESKKLKYAECIESV